MASALSINWDLIGVLIGMLLAPIGGSLLISLMYRLIEREIPPILPLINTLSLGQALITLVVVGFSSPASRSSSYLLDDMVVIVGLFAILLWQANIDKSQEAKTQENVKKVLREKLGPKISPRAKLDNLLEVAKTMIDVDFLPTSLTNRLSGFQRRERRIQFLNLVRSCVVDTDRRNIDINQEDLLVPERERASLNRSYVWVTVISFTFYVISVAIFLAAQY